MHGTGVRQRARRILAGRVGRSSDAMLRRRAGLAAPEQVQLVALECEAFGRALLELAAAADEVVHLVAGVATEVMVVPHARALVARRLARQLDLRDVALVDEPLDGAIHRGHAE